jgi:hypothetical protein
LRTLQTKTLNAINPCPPGRPEAGSKLNWQSAPGEYAQSDMGPPLSTNADPAIKQREVGTQLRGSHMSVLERLFTGRPKIEPARCAIVVGDGQFQTYIASTPQQRSELGRLCDGRTENAPRFPVLLVPQPSSPRGRDAVAVRKGETTIGYLHHTTAVEFMSALRANEFERAACAATVIARPDPQLGKTVFSLRLDAEVPFKLVTPRNNEPAS